MGIPEKADAYPADLSGGQQQRVAIARALAMEPHHAGVDIAIQEAVRSGRILSQTAGNPFVGGDVTAPILQVMIFVGVLFIAFNLALSRLSWRLETRESRRTATRAPSTVEQPAAA